MKQLYTVIIILGLVVFIGLIATAGAKGGGSLSDPDYYCRVLLKGNLIGDNLELNDLECGGLPYPASLLDFEARLFGGDDSIKCQVQVDNNVFGDEKNIGDLGFSESAFYNFKLSNVAPGNHLIKVRCQGESESVEKTYSFSEGSA